MARILLVDDDAHIARVLSIWLTRHGHTALCAANGKAALACLRARPVDLVITDMNMPELDGLAFIKELRRSVGDALPVMVLSARCDQQEMVDALAAYGVPVYPKPFLPSYMVAEIHRMLGVAGLPQAEGVP